MKVLNISLRNLNSITGKWNIDLSHNAYDDGIFVISGPTGAGKTTILDAICLALYGRTPRVSVTHARNEIMTRTEDECWAEVTFMAGNGLYRSEFKQKKKRGRGEGFEDYTLKVYDEKGREVRKSIEKLTGLKFNQFTSAVMLPQGQFRNFLEAKDDERSKILEKITSTQIYSQISTKVYNMYNEAQSRYNAVKAEMDALGVLGEEDEKELAAKAASSRAALEALAKTIEQAGIAIGWHKNLNSLYSRLAEESRTEESLADEEKAFSQARQSIKMANAAEILRPPFARMEYILKSNQNDSKALAEEERSLALLAGEMKQRALACDKAQNELKILEAEFEKKRPLLEKIRTMDRDIKRGRLEYESLSRECAALREKTHTCAAGLKAARAEKEKNQERQCEIAEWLELNKRDGEISLELGAMRAAREEIVKKRAEMKNMRAQLAREKEKLENAREKEIARQINLKDKEELCANADGELQREAQTLKSILAGNTVEELRREKEALLVQRYKIQNVHGYSQERGKLVEGEECPLCGARHHPYVDKGIPRADPLDEKIGAITEKIAAIDAGEARIKSLRDKREKYRQQLELVKQDALTLENNRKRAEDSFKTASASIDLALAEAGSREKDLREKILPFCNTLPDSLDDALALLEKRAEYWNWQLEESRRLETAIRDLQAREMTFSAVAERDGEELKKKEAGLEAARENLSALEMRRACEYGNLDADREEQNLAGRLEKSKKDADVLLETRIKAEKIFSEANGRLEELKTRLAKNENELLECQAQFEKALQESPFASEQEFRAAILAPGEKERLERAAKDLDARKSANAGAKRHILDEIQREKQRNLGEKSLDVLELEKTGAEKEAAVLREALGGLKAKLEENDRKKAAARDKDALLRKLEIDVTRLGKLNRYIGNNSGIGFNRKAQNFTFGVIVQYANEHLAQLTDRYVLYQHPVIPFQLNVVDKDQFGEERSIKTLSGGETFLVSLALALGLSRMASDNAPIDCLFLDEGFGTLDEESLDMAIRALSSLRNEGKLIGIISHVEELKNRIAARIEIEKKGAGRSVISGPGCSRL